MVKLVPAKCPSCGANLKVDDNLKRTECEFCKTVIIVDEAIQKYQVELTGKVKVGGIQDENEELEIINKYIQIKKYDEAVKRINKLLDKNPFNIDANITLIKMFVDSIENRFGDILKVTYKDLTDIDTLLFMMGEYDMNKLKDKMEILIGIEIDSRYKGFIEKVKKIYNHFLIIMEEGNKNNCDRKKLIEKCNSYLYVANDGTIDGKMKVLKKSYKKLNLLLKSLQFDESKYKKNFIDFRELYCDKENFFRDGTSGIIRECVTLKATFITENSITISHVYEFKREKTISFQDQIQIVENLMNSDKSIFSKIFNKK